MARPVYPYELNDPDYCWLINHFEETHPNYFMVQDGSSPVVFIREQEEKLLIDRPIKNQEGDTK
jgi:hypothetical protein